MISWIGSAAAVLTTISFVPQAWRVVKTKNVSSISLPMYILFTTGVACWTIYGWVEKDWPVFFANAITLVFASIILVCKIKYGHEPALAHAK